MSGKSLMPWLARKDGCALPAIVYRPCVPLQKTYLKWEWDNEWVIVSAHCRPVGNRVDKIGPCRSGSPYLTSGDIRYLAIGPPPSPHISWSWSTDWFWSSEKSIQVRRIKVELWKTVGWDFEHDLLVSVFFHPSISIYHYKVYLSL